ESVWRPLSMSPEHDNNLQPTLEMSASESASDASQTAASQVTASQETGAATAAVRAPDATPSAPAVEESAGSSASTDGHGADRTVVPVSGTEENSAETNAPQEAAAYDWGVPHPSGFGPEISGERAGAEATDSSETMDQLL